MYYLSIQISAMNKPALLFCLFLIPFSTLFSQKNLQPTATEAVVILFVRGPSGQAVNNADLVLSHSDKTWSGSTNREGIAKFLLPIGCTFTVDVEDDKNYFSFSVPGRANQIIRQQIYYQGIVNGKSMPVPAQPLFQASPAKNILTQVTVRYVDLDNHPLANEEVHITGPGIDLLDTTDANGNTLFYIPAGQTYLIGNAIIPEMGELALPRITTGSGSMARVTYAWIGSAAIAENALLEKLSAEEHEKEVAAWHELGGKSDPPSGLVQTAKDFKDLAEETGGKLTIVSERESLLPAMELIIGKELKPGADVVILMDVTGSMSDDIRMVREGVQGLLKAFESIPDVEVGIACYGDSLADGDRWYFARDLSPDLTELSDDLNSIQVTGGGDWPESVYDGLVRTLSEFSWRKNEQHIILLLGDAPPLKEGRTQYLKDDVVKRCKRAGVVANLYPVVIGYH